MGIYIPGIETPKGHNYVTITIWPSGTASYGLFNREENLCDFKSIKAVPVPAHGRLIEEEPIIKYITDGLNIGRFGYDAIEVMAEIKYAPTIIPAEEE